MSVMDQIDIRYERDELTGLLSMDGIIQFVQSRGEDTYDSYSMVYMSIPTFKKLNLGYGYECGNRFLISTAEGIKRFFPDAYAARESSHHFTFFIMFKQCLTKFFMLVKISSSGHTSWQHGSTRTNKCTSFVRCAISCSPRRTRIPEHAPPPRPQRGCRHQGIPPAAPR